MAIYSSQLSALNSNAPQQGEPDTIPRRKLTSCFFANSEEILGIYYGTHNVLTAHKDVKTTVTLQYKEIDGPELVSPFPTSTTTTVTTQYLTTYRGEYITRIQKAFRVIMASSDDHPIFDINDAHNIKNGYFDDQYSGSLRGVVIAFQTWMGFDPGDRDGIFGPQTLDAMDRLLADIKYYDCETGEILHNASICEDEITITKVYQNAIVYRKPDLASTQMATLTALVSKVYIIQDIDNDKPGWLFVQFDPGSAATTYSKNRAFGYIKADKILSKKSMPDSGASLVLIPPFMAGAQYDDIRKDTVYRIIRQEYYHSVGGTLVNDLGYELKTNPNSFGISINQRAYNQFKFYVNLLLFVNNPTGIDPAEGIYLTYPGSQNIDPQLILDHFENFNPYNNPYEDPGNNNKPTNYEYFLNVLSSQHSEYHWDWDGNNTILLVEGVHIWIPSKDFADRLYSYINNHEDKLAQYHNSIRNSVIAKWKRGFGVELEGSIGVTFGIPVRVEAGGAITLYRKYTANPSEVVMVLKKHGRIQLGIDVGIGGGVYVGNGTQNKAGATFGAAIRAQAGAYGELECFTEYEFPLYDATATTAIGRRDLSSLALFTALVGTATDAAEFAAVEFQKLLRTTILIP